MQRISVFDMLKIGVGPSSSHTMGPWRAAQRFLRELGTTATLTDVKAVQVELFGSLAKTGKGHGTGMAVMMGLRNEDPTTCDTTTISDKTAAMRTQKTLLLGGTHSIAFDPATDIIYHYDQTLPFHPNGVRFNAHFADGHTPFSREYFSVGGGFVVTSDEPDTPTASVTLPYPTNSAADVLAHCSAQQMNIAQMVWHNEQVWRTPQEIREGLLRVWHTMADCIYRGCHTRGELPGGLQVTRRAANIHYRLLETDAPLPREAWIAEIRDTQHRHNFQDMLSWLSCFALAVNEENAAFGRVVTAPTNGSAGVLPAVLMHTVCFYGATDEDVIRFLMVAGEIGSLFKKNATISAAMGGCQAEIGVSSAMAAAALTEYRGGSVAQALMAAEIAMEHHLGLTCDPIGGLVQVPCIERNAMGAAKAITAAQLALESQPQHAKVSLDTVIQTMWQTAQDMHAKYKETSEGGLALNISVNVIEC